MRRLGVLRKASGKICLHSWKTAKRASYFDSMLATRFFCPSTSRIPRNKNGPTDCSVSPLAFLWCRRGDSKFSALSVLITHCNTIQYFNKIKKLGRVVFLYRCGTVKSTITDLIFRFPLTSFLGFPVQNPPPLLRPIPLPRTRKPPAY